LELQMRSNFSGLTGGKWYYGGQHKIDLAD
jgi:hypothetical protein